MKAYLLLLFSCLTFLPAVAQNTTGVMFFKGTWQEALAEAQRQQKPLFVDVYTTWCGPCKQMDKEVFTNPNVAARYNTAFVNYKLDAEKGEGPAIAKQYAVASYPNLLYLSAEGSLIHRGIGYGGIEAMLKDADKTLELAVNYTPMSQLDRTYTDSKGKNTPQFLRQYLLRRAQLRLPNNEALADYLTTLPADSLQMPATMHLIAGNLTDVRSTAYASLLNYIKKLLYSDLASDKGLAHEINYRMQSSIKGLMRQATQAKNEVLLEEAIAAEVKLATITGRQFSINAHSPERLASDRRLFYLKDSGQMERFRELAIATANRLMAISDDSLRGRDKEGAVINKKMVERLVSSQSTKPHIKQTIFLLQHEASAEVSERLWSVSSLCYRQFTELADNQRALEWNTRALALNRTGSVLLNQSNYLYKVGRTDESTDVLKETIAAMKEEGRDVKMLEEILANRPAKK